MIELSIAFVIIACITGFLFNKWLDQRQQELDRKYLVSIEADSSAAISALTEQIHTFDQRINDTWGTISSIKSELESTKLQMALRNR